MPEKNKINKEILRKIPMKIGTGLVKRVQKTQETFPIEEETKTHEIFSVSTIYK